MCMRWTLFNTGTADFTGRLLLPFKFVGQSVQICTFDSIQFVCELERIWIFLDKIF